MTPNVGEAVDRQGRSYIAVENIKRYRHFAKQTDLKGARAMGPGPGQRFSRCVLGRGRGPVPRPYQCPVLVVIRSYCFTRCYHWGRREEGRVGSRCNISYNCMRICNDLKIKFNLKISLSLKCQDCVIFLTTACESAIISK